MFKTFTSTVTAVALGLLVLLAPVIDQETTSTAIKAKSTGYAQGQHDGYREGLAAGLGAVRIASAVVVVSCGHPKFYMLVATNGAVVLLNPGNDNDMDDLAQVKDDLPPFIVVEESSDCV